ncbi:hypothetical protein MAR_003211 [Mya arenaria]|uniref:Shieldin complex subunit 2 first OB fold domain-containing protein n=1 Tax=Mya arenaria TaxID=6604 RepID=A0ABY7G5D5_MYAAR|nr:hypothetical protein MAR_003211 [Mya arenaria]
MGVAIQQWRAQIGCFYKILVDTVFQMVIASIAENNVRKNKHKFVSIVPEQTLPSSQTSTSIPLHASPIVADCFPPSHPAVCAPITLIDLPFLVPVNQPVVNSKKRKKSSNDRTKPGCAQTKKQKTSLSDSVEVHYAHDGAILKKRSRERVLYTVGYNIDSDRENHFRELIMLYLPWRNESKLIDGYVSFEEKYNIFAAIIDKNKQSYHRMSSSDLANLNSDLLHFTPDNDIIVAQSQQQNDLDELEGSTESQLYKCFDPGRPDNTYDLALDLGIGRNQKCPDGKKTIVSAIDSISGDIPSHLKTKLLSKIPEDSNKTKGLSKYLHIAEECPAELCANIDVSDGLANGTPCLIKKLEFRVPVSDRCSIIWVHFDEQNVGKTYRNQYKHLFTVDIPSHYTPIIEINRQDFNFLASSFIVFSETKLNVQPSVQYELPGFNLYRNDGYIGIVYCSPKNASFDSFKKVFQVFNTEFNFNKPLVIMATMTSLLDIMKKTGPLPQPLRVLVAAVAEPYTYAPEKQLLKLTLCDATAMCKAVVFDAKKFPKFKENSGVVLHNAVLNKDREVVVTTQTRVFVSVAPEVPADLLLSAIEVIRPTPPDIVPIDRAKRSPAKQRTSIQGQIVNDSVATTVMVNDKEVNVRTITVEDRTGKVKVSLWRNIAAEPVVLGDVVAITNIVVNSKRYNNEESLSSTQFTKIEDYLEADLEAVLLGDSGYPLRRYLITPILHPSNENEESSDHVLTLIHRLKARSHRKNFAGAFLERSWPPLRQRRIRSATAYGPSYRSESFELHKILRAVRSGQFSAPAKFTTAPTTPSQSLAPLDASSWTLGSARPTQKS